MPKKSIIRTEKLCKSFSSGGVMQHVIKNLDTEIYEGDFTVIMGSSGAGKSTLLYALSGMDKASLGKVYFSEKISRALTATSWPSSEESTAVSFSSRYTSWIP